MVSNFHIIQPTARPCHFGDAHEELHVVEDAGASHRVWCMPQGFLTSASKMLKEYIITKEGDKDVKNTNPAYETWVSLYQHVLGFLLSSLTREVLQQVAACKNVADVWKTVESSLWLPGLRVRGQYLHHPSYHSERKYEYC
jgi:hypothetical protein